MRKLPVLFVLLALAFPEPAGARGRAAEPARPSVMVLGVAHLVAKRDIYNSVFQDSPLSAKRQAQIAQVVGRLARFHPTKVLIEAAMGNPEYAQRYRRYLAGRFSLPANEIYQFGFRLAARAGNRAIYPVDTMVPHLLTATPRRVNGSAGSSRGTSQAYAIRSLTHSSRGKTSSSGAPHTSSCFAI